VDGPATTSSVLLVHRRSRWLSSALALALLLVASLAQAGELQWRSSRSAVVQRQTTVIHDAAVRPVADESPRSVVVNRGAKVAQNSQYDPFEDDVAAPEAAAPAGEGQFDPFEADDAAPAEEPTPEQELPAEESPIAETAAPPADVQEAFDEPAVEEDVPTAADELEAAQEAIDREMMRREVESGAAEEMVAPETEAGEDDSTLEVVPEMEDEIVPPVDEESYDDELMGDEDLELDMQYGEDIPETPEQIEARRRQVEQERIEHQQECATLYEQAKQDSIKNISLDIRLHGTAGEDYPFECEGMRPAFEPRAWSQTVYLWKASGICHKPLYFEQVQLERYGHDWGPVLQPIMSGAHFFGTIPILPYKMGLETPQECVYTLGYYRPGSCAPYMITQPGFTWRAAAFEAAAVTGVSAAVP
jgi:hypothetical protein